MSSALTGGNEMIPAETVDGSIVSVNEGIIGVIDDREETSVVGSSMSVEAVSLNEA